MSQEFIVFRDFRPQDLLDVQQMILALYEGDTSGEPMTAEKIQQTIDHLTRHQDQGRIILFCTDDLIVGYAILIYYWSNEYGGYLLNVDELYVKKPYRNRGIATRFLEHISAGGYGIAQGLQLEVTPTNEQASMCYQRFGFAPSRNTHLFKKLQ